MGRCGNRRPVKKKCVKVCTDDCNPPESDILFKPHVLQPLSRIIKAQKEISTNTKCVESCAKLKNISNKNHIMETDKRQKGKGRSRKLWDFKLFGMNDYDIIPCSSSSIPLPSNDVIKSVEEKCKSNEKQCYPCVTPSILPRKRKSDSDLVLINTKRQKSDVKGNISDWGLSSSLIESNFLQKSGIAENISPYSKNVDSISVINCSYGTPLTVFEKHSGVELTDVSFSQNSSEQEGNLSSVVENIISGLSENKDSSSEIKNATDASPVKPEKQMDTCPDGSHEMTPTSVLKGVTTFVEVRNEFEDISEAVAKQLVRLGATVSKTLNKKVTHVVFKNGRPSTQKKALSQGAHMVSVLWVDMCKQNNKKVDESLYPSLLQESKSCDNILFPKKNKRFRCMQPKDFKQEFAQSAEKLKEIFSRVKRIHTGSKTPVSDMVNSSLVSGSVKEGYKDSATPGKKRKLPPIQKRKLFGDQEPLYLCSPSSAVGCGSNSNVFEENLLPDDIKGKLNVEMQPGRKMSKDKVSGAHKSSGKWKHRHTPTNETSTVLKERECINRTPKRNGDNNKLVKDLSNKQLNMRYTPENAAERSHVHSQILKPYNAGNQVKTGIYKKENLVNGDALFNSNCATIPKNCVSQANACSASKATASPSVRTGLSETNRMVSESSLDDFKIIDKKLKRQIKKDSKIHHIGRDVKRSTLRIKLNDLVLTNISLSEEDSIRSIVRSMGGFNLCEAYTQNTTHVICGSNKRTLKVLYALACGCWLLSPQWVFKSLETGFWLDEELYELVDYFPAAKLCRTQKKKSHSNSQSLFCDLGLIYISPHSNPSKEKMSQLITMAGGKVTNSLQRCSLAVGTLDRDAKCSMVVSEKWILDCITSHKILPFVSKTEHLNDCGN